MIAQVTVSKPVDGVLTRQHSSEEGTILLRYRIELGIAFAVFDTAPAQVVQCLDGLTFWLHMCQGFEVTMIGLSADLRVAPEVGHAFAHRHPPPRVTLRGLNNLEDFELARIVDRGLNAQYTPLIVHLNVVALHTMFHPAPLGAFLQTGFDFPFEITMQLASQKPEHIFSREVQGSMFEQVGEYCFQAGSVLERRHFTLIGDPIVFSKTCCLDRGQHGVQPPCKGVQHSGPLAMCQAFTQLLCGFQVLNVCEAIVVPFILDPSLIHLAGQPLMTIDVDLYLKGEPALQADMHETKLWIDEIEIEVQAFAWFIHHFQFVCLAIATNAEGFARFHTGKDTNQPLGDAFLLGKLFGVYLQRRRSSLHIGLEVLEQHTLTPEKPGKRAAWEETGQVSLEDNPVKCGENAHNAALVCLKKRFHDLSPLFVVLCLLYRKIGHLGNLAFGCGRRPRYAVFAANSHRARAAQDLGGLGDSLT